MTRWTETDDQILRKLHKEGKTDKAISEHLGRSVGGVEHRRWEMKLTANPARIAKKFTAAELSVIRQQCREGSPITTIAKRFGYPQDTVSAAVRDIIEARKANRETLNDRIISLRKKTNLSCGEIAAKLHIGRNQVIGVLHRAGISGPGYYKPKPGKFAPKAKANQPTVTRDPYRGEAPTGCRYPHGEGAGLTWCNEQRREGSPYCPDHHLLTHVQRPALEAAE